MQLLCIVFFTFAETYPDSDDARVVCIRQTNFRADWIRGAATGEEYWALANAFIAAKHAEKVDRRRCSFRCGLYLTHIHRFPVLHFRH
jgi:hypothetical protein